MLHLVQILIVFQRSVALILSGTVAMQILVSTITCSYHNFQYLLSLVLNIDHNKKELGGRRIKLAVRFAPRSLEGNRPQEYKEVRWLSLPRVASKVDGCSVKCPRFSADGKYLVLTRNIQKNTKSRISAEKYYIISYESGRKDYLLEELKKCKDNSK